MISNSAQPNQTQHTSGQNGEKVRVSLPKAADFERTEGEQSSPVVLFFSPQKRNGIMISNLQVQVKSASTTPKKSNGSCGAFCRTINPYAKQVYLPFTSVDERYIHGNCFTNVWHCILNRGGVSVCGWIIWEVRNPKLMGYRFDAEHHSIWQNPEGDLVDITPRVDGERLILFLPDPQRSFDFSTLTAFSNRTDSPEIPYAQWATETHRIAPSRESRFQAERLGFEYKNGGMWLKDSSNLSQ